METMAPSGMERTVQVIEFFFFFLKERITSSHRGLAVTNPTSILEDVGSVPALA